MLQLQLPSSAIMEGDVHWNLKNNTAYNYQTRGKLRVERQECQVSKANSFFIIMGFSISTVSD